jgi:hypothetical protein
VDQSKTLDGYRKIVNILNNFAGEDIGITEASDPDYLSLDER